MTERSPSQNQCLTEKFSEVLIQRLNYVLLSLILLAQSVYVQGSNEANLTTSKAVSVPGGYVVPVHDDIVFRCHAPGVHENNFLLWNIDLGPLSLNGTATFELGKESNHKLTVDEKYKKNPAEVHIHSLQLNESGSKIQCLGFAGAEEVVISSIVHIYVEDSPKCPGNLTITETPLGFNLTWSGHSGLLPVTYNTSVVSNSSEVVISTSNSHISLVLEEIGYKWPSNTTFFVSVTACTSAGCSQDCGNTTMRTGELLVIVHDSLPTKVGRNSMFLSVGTLVIIVVPVTVALFTIILIVVILLFCCIASCRMSKTRDVDQKSAAQQNDHEHMSEREVQDTDGVNHTSIDVTGVVMEENPSYCTMPIRMGEIDVAELPPPLPLRPQDTVNLDMQENPSYSPLQTNSVVYLQVYMEQLPNKDIYIICRQ